MPGWHAKTKDLVAANKLKVVGIVQEQHPERAALFMQWHQMDWPVYSDPLNLLGVYAIPYTFLIDEHGIIRYKNPKAEDLKTFLATDYEKPEKLERTNLTPKPGTAEHLLLFGNEKDTGKAISQLQKRAANAADDAVTQFRLGVAYRMRYDSPHRDAKDFANAIASWEKALALNPKQYIWRRRIQQYGPRLDKPYSFYDWVEQARTDITKRGEIPQKLETEPAGSEFATARDSPTALGDVRHPDPDRKLPRDELDLIQSSVIVVPSTNKSKPAFRIHLQFNPSTAQKVHWTNDAGILSFFPEENDSVTIHDLRQPGNPPNQATSSEERRIEFEVRPAKGKKKLPKFIRGSAFYYVCEDVNGVCQFLRQDIEIKLGD